MTEFAQSIISPGFAINLIGTILVNLLIPYFAKQKGKSQAQELNLRQPGFCMPDRLLFGQPKANNYSRKLYQAELAWDKFNRYILVLNNYRSKNSSNSKEF